MTHMDPDQAYGLELLAAVRALPAGAAPLVAAMVRDGCVAVPNAEAMLAALAGMAGAGGAAATEAAGRAMVRAWRAAQARAEGAQPDPTHWQALADMGAGETSTSAAGQRPSTWLRRPTRTRWLASCGNWRVHGAAPRNCLTPGRASVNPPW